MGALQLWILQLGFWASGAVFSYEQEKREHFWLRSGCFFVVTLIEGLLFQFFWDGQVWLMVWGRVFSCIFMVIILTQCWKLSWTEAIYNMIWGTSLWQMILELWKILRVIGEETFTKSSLADVILLFALMNISYIVAAKTIAAWMPKDRKKLGPRQLSSALLIFLIVELLSYSPALSGFAAYNEDWKFLFLSQMMCLVILYMQNELFKKSEIKQELTLMNLLWEKEKEQYQLSKENIALINQKCHDLKHQIKAIRQASREERERYLNELEESVQIYESVVKTGNEVFDTILTEKSLYCKDRGIKVTYVVDGAQLGFLDTIDLYALLGNAIDNAIEAVEKFEDIEKRQIDVMIYKQQNFLIMNFINPMPEKLVYDEELPVTTKRDKLLHGFGLRSMWHLVKKYEGTMNISEEDGCFSLKMLIPIPNC